MSYSMRNVFLFFIGLIAIILLLDFGIKKTIYSIANGEYGTLNRLVEGKINTEILIAGSSRAHVHFNPAVISGITGKTCYNIGQDGEQLNLQLPILKAYLKHNAPPKLLVQSLDIFSGTYKKFVLNKKKYYPYLYEPLIYDGLAEFDHDIILMKYVPLYGYLKYCDITEILNNLFQKKDNLINGFRGEKNKKWRRDFQKFKNNNPEGKIFPIEEKAIDCLKGIIKLCQQYHIEMIFVYSPEYFEAYPFEKNRDEIIGLFKKLALENNYEFYDYSNTAISRQMRYFYNANHLNMEGANIFSADIAKKIAQAPRP